jgi:hypothetical protein
MVLAGEIELGELKSEAANVQFSAGVARDGMVQAPRSTSSFSLRFINSSQVTMRFS